MSYFLLPYIIDPIDPNYIELKEGITKQKISKSLSSYLNKMKEQINNYQVEWDIYKKYTNRYPIMTSTILNTVANYVSSTKLIANVTKVSCVAEPCSFLDNMCLDNIDYMIGFKIKSNVTLTIN